MNAVLLTPTLAQKTGHWRPVFWEPVMASGERLCVGIVTTLDGKTVAHKALRPGVLTALYGAAAEGAEALLDQAFAVLDKFGEMVDVSAMESPFAGVVLGNVELAHANSARDLVDIGLLMSSSLCNLSDPGHLDAAEVASDGGKRVNQQFITRVRTHVALERPALASCFNIEAKLLATKRPVRFGFLSDRLVAHLGLLHATNLNSAVRNARGLMTEVRMAHVAREGQGKAGLVIGYSPLQSPNLSLKDRDAIVDCVEELRLEADELNVEFRAADTDPGCASALVSLC